jgi:hypothetical protein
MSSIAVATNRRQVSCISLGDHRIFTVERSYQPRVGHGCDMDCHVTINCTGREVATLINYNDDVTIFNTEFNENFVLECRDGRIIQIQYSPSEKCILVTTAHYSSHVEVWNTESRCRLTKFAPADYAASIFGSAPVTGVHPRTNGIRV